ncbi:MAG: DsbA family protein [Marinibacterium sp.]
MKRMIPILAALLALPLTGILLGSGGTSDAPGRAFGLPGAAVAQQAPVVQEMTMGAEDAPITMIEYASFTCPHCANFHGDTLKKIKADYIDTGKVRLIYREVYFDRFGLWASMVARCAGPDRFFGVADLIFSGLHDWAYQDSPQAIAGELKKIGRMAGLDDATLDACMQDRETAQALVSWYQENANKDDIRATPSFVIDGEKVSNQPYSDFKALFDSKLGE